VQDIYVAYFEDFAYEVWCARTVIRNHPDILQRIRACPAELEMAREWHRDGFVVAVDLHARDHPGSIPQKIGRHIVV
jgi:hypothetical protein